MGIFGDSSEETKTKNTVIVDNTNDLKVEANELLAILIIIAVLVLILVILRIVAIIKKSTRRQTTRDQVLMGRIPSQQ